MASNTDGPAEASHPKPQGYVHEEEEDYVDVSDFSYTWETNKPNYGGLHQHMEDDDEDYYDVSDFSYSWEHLRQASSNSSQLVQPSIPSTPPYDPESDSWFTYLRLEHQKRRQLRRRLALLKGTSFIMSLKVNRTPRAEPSGSSCSSTHVHDESCLGIPLMPSSRPPQCSYFDCNKCLNMAREPVVTSCGYVYCWPC